jgi:IS30 family transposase
MARNLLFIKSSPPLFRLNASSLTLAQAWERGLNENTNGLIRQYLPKGTDFDMLSRQDINLIMDHLNNRPRKALAFNTPKKLFLEACQKVALGT